MRILDSVFKVGSIVVIFVLIFSSFIIIFNNSTMVRSQGLSEDSPWPCFGQNEGRSGSVYDGSEDISISEGWNRELEGVSIGSPVITNDGDIIQPAGDSLYSMNSRGEINWEYSFDYFVEGTPSIAEDGTIYIGSADRNLTALNPDGTEKWRFPTGSRIDSSPVIGEDGDIYFGNNDGVLYRIDNEGKEVWNTNLKLEDEERMIQSSPALDDDGVIYIASVELTQQGLLREGVVHAIDPDGVEKWRYERGFGIISSPAVGEDGNIYIGGGDGHLFALDKNNGEEIWASGTAGQIFSSPAIGSDGTIYVGSFDNNLYAINQDGTKRWNYTTNGTIFSSPSIGQDGTIFFGSSDENIYALNPDGSLRWNKTADSEVFASPAIDEDGSVYITSYQGTVYAFTSEERIFEITNMHILILIGIIVAVGIFSAFHYSDKKGHQL